MMDQGQRELEELKDIPGFKAIMRALIKSQMKYLAEEMKHHIGEETLILSASAVEGTMSHVGTEAGRKFIYLRDDIKSQFRDHCLKISKSRGDVSNSSQIHSECIKEGKSVQSNGFSVKVQDGKRKHPIDHSNNEIICVSKKTRYSVPEKPVSTGIIIASDGAKCIPSESIALVRSCEQGKYTLCNNKTASTDILGVCMPGKDVIHGNMENEEQLIHVTYNAENCHGDSGKIKQEDNTLLSSQIDSRNAEHIENMENPFLSNVSSKIDTRIEKQKEIAFLKTNIGSNNSSSTDHMDYSLPSASNTSTDTGTCLDVNVPCSVKIEPLDDDNDQIQIQVNKGSFEMALKDRQGYNDASTSQQEDRPLNSSSEQVRLVDDDMLYNVIVNEEFSDADDHSDTSLSVSNSQGSFNPGSLIIEEWELPIVNKNTRRKTENDLRKFQNYLLSKNQYTPMFEINHDTLDGYIADFITNIRKPDGSEYQPNSLQAMLNSLDRMLAKHNNPATIMKADGGQFSLTRNALKAKQLSLEQHVKGSKYKSAAKLTDRDIVSFYEKRVVSLDSPGTLLNLLWLNNYLGFQLIGTQEHRQLRWGDICLKKGSDGIEYLELNTQQIKERCHEDASKTQYAPRKIFAVNDERDPIRAYKLYRLKRPHDYCEDSSPFYLTPVTGRIYVYVTDFDHEPWFNRTQLSERKMFTILKTMARDAGILHYKYITNHSATKLLKEKVKDFLKQKKKIKEGLH